jgi:pimeloyl-ACP methyl ester carboxylesterase
MEPQKAVFERGSLFLCLLLQSPSSHSTYLRAMRFSLFPHKSASATSPTEGSFVQTGRGSRTVVFLHGLFGSTAHWTGTMEHLANDYRSIAIQLPLDQKGDRRNQGVQTIGELTEVVDRSIAAAKVDSPFVLVGNSLGGLLSIDYALKYPDRVCGLVLAGSAGLQERSLTDGNKPKATREFVRSVIGGIFYDQALVTDDLVEDWFETMSDRNYTRFILRISRATRDRNVQQELDQIKTPTLIVWGRNDQITPPEVGLNFQSSILGSKIVFLESCGHVPNVEQPDQFNQQLSEFLPQCFS